MLGDTPVSAYERVLAGHLFERRGYRVIRRHGSGDHLLIMTVTGRGRAIGAQGVITIGPGDILLLRPEVPHDYAVAKGVEHWELLFAHIEVRPEWHALLDWPLAAGTLGLIRPTGALRTRVAGYLEEAGALCRSGHRTASMMAANAVEAALLWCDVANPLSGAMDPRIVRVLDHVARHLGSSLTTSQLADVAALSPSRLFALFAEQVGQSPQRFVEQQRLAAAKQLLEMSSNSVTRVATTVGFADPLYFSKRFRKVIGCSPTEYRRRFVDNAGGPK